LVAISLPLAVASETAADDVRQGGASR